MLRYGLVSRRVASKRIHSTSQRHYSDYPTSSTYSEGGQPRRFRPTSSQSTPGAPAATERTFVSSHYKVDEEQVERYLARRNIMFQPYGNSLKLQCPFCAPDRNRSGFRLVVSKENGHFNCSACNSKGSWFDFQKKLQSTSIEPGRPQSTTDPRKVAALTGMTRASQSMRSNATAAAVAESHSKALPEQDKLSKHLENLKKLPSVAEFLTQEKKIEQSTLDKYKVGGCVLRIAETISRGPQAGEKRTTDHYCVSFPWIDTTKAGKEVLVRMKTRSIDPKSNLVRLDPQVGRASFFGWHLISRDAKVIIVTEDEFDAMAVYQATGEPAVALAAGASYQLPIELVDKLDKFDQIYLWMHDNVGSQEVAKKWADKLGRERVYLVPSKLSSNRDNETEDAVSAWEAFSRGTDLTALIKSSKPLPHQEIVTFKDLREEVYRELAHPEQVAGVPSITFPSLNKILRGHRRGELTVFTGPTGIGKTTILAQMSLDYLRQGVSTLWGSFEINNVRLAKKMITQFAEKSLEGEESLDTYESVADKFSSLPLHFMRFHGNTGLEAVFDAMEYAVYVYDVEHIVLDNLQFMTPTHLVKGFDKFDQLDMSIARLRKFATSKNIHITIIIHPRKEDDGATLSTSSVFGTAKATQESDNVVILQKGKNYRYIEVTKNRFSGDLGRVPFRFDPATLKFSELTQEEVSALDAGKPYVPAPPPTDPSEGNDESVIPPPPQSLMDDTVLEHASSAAPVRKGKKKAQKAAAEVAAEASGDSTTSVAPEAAESSRSEQLAEERISEAIAQATESGEDNLGIDPSQLQAMPESNHTELDEDGDRQRIREKLEQAKLADKVVEAGEAASNAAKI